MDAPMRWRSAGHVFVPDGRVPWMASHATLPVVDRVSEAVLRVYFASRDPEGRSRLARLDVAADDPTRVLAVHDRPLLPLGRPGTFDESGMAPSWIVDVDGRKYLYYIGWSRPATVPYHTAIGLAVSDDGGETFTRCSEGPVRDRSLHDPFFATGPCVLHDHGLWRMWYASGLGWEMIAGRLEPLYHVRYTESRDGIHWSDPGTVAVDCDDAFTRAIARPCVWRDGGGYHMLYSHRSAVDYRTDPARAYRLGYAASPDGRTWRRLDDRLRFVRSAAGWDADMVEYAFVYTHKGRRYMVYNGNGFGKSGFGYAVLEPSPGAEAA